MKDEFELLEEIPDVEAYRRLRRIVGWEDVDFETAALGLKNALYSLTLKHKGEVVGCGRVVGDGAIYFYIQDIIVTPEYQGRRLGARIMEKVMGFIETHARDNSFIGLMAAKGVEDFYLRYGFETRPPDRPGMYRMWTESKTDA